MLTEAQRLILSEIFSRVQMGLLTPVAAFRCRKMLLDHPERLVAGASVTESTDHLEVLANGAIPWTGHPNRIDGDEMIAAQRLSKALG